MATLDYHSAPVISLLHLAVPEQPAADRPSDVISPSNHSTSTTHHLVFSGATDGGIAVWDLSEAATAAGGSALQPILALPAAHQSGVNALSVARLGAGALLLVSGGDDQALRLTLLQLRPSEGGRPALEASAEAHVANAHSSAVKVLLLGCTGSIFSSLIIDYEDL